MMKKIPNLEAFKFSKKKQFIINFYSACLFLLLSTNSFGQTFTDNNPAAPNTWTVPAGVNSITVEVWGAGGAGGGSTIQNSGGSGGGGGAYALRTIAVTPSQVINYTIGTGGAGSNGNGNNGTSSTILTLSAGGGIGGTANGGAGGAGGVASGGTTNSNGNVGGTGGGNPGGDGGDGANAGGAGGNGISNGNGSPGASPGGGGGGAERQGGGSSGGNGGNGQVVITWTVGPPPPSNDLCANATTLNCNDTNIAGTTIGTTNATSGSTCGSGDHGVWYTFTGDGQQTTISSTAIGAFDHEMSIASGSCGTLTNVTCQDIELDGGTETYTFTTTNGLDYYIYIADWLSGSTDTGDFTISRSCTAPPTAPANDDCAGAISLTVNPDLACGTVTSGTIDSATNSGITSACGGTDDDDVWYTFVATSTSHIVDLSNIAGSTTDLYHAVYATNPCTGPDTALTCSDPNNSTTGGLTIGATYYVQVYSWTSTTGQDTTFDICIGTPPPPPANDDCAGAISLTVNPDLACSTVTSGTIDSATNSGIASACGGTDDDDVWYTFVATSTSHIVDLSNITGSTTDLYHAVYATNPCTGPDTALTCSDPNNSTTGGLTIGATYYVQVYSWTSITGQDTTFDICIGTPPPPPANDDCAGAISLTVNPDFSCGSVTPGTLYSSTNSGITSACGGTDDDDVWYTFVATSTTHTVDLLNVNGSTTDLYHAIYATNPCTGPDTALTCSDPNNSTTSGLTIGATYYVQVYSWSSTTGQTTTFDICIGTPPPPPANDEPCGAVSLTVNSTCIGITGTVGSATDSGIDACFGTPDNDVWYSFVATNTSQTVTLFNIFGSETDMYHAVYGPFTPPDCSVAVADNISCNDGNSTDLTSLTVGATYFVQVFTYYTGPETTSFDICVTEPCSNTDPINMVPTVCPLIAGEENVDPFVSPFDPDPSFNLDCSNPTLTLEAHSTIRNTDSYIVEQIDYGTPNYSPTGFSTPQVITNDDVWADSWTTLPFNFCFYGTTYTELLVGANGMITFDSANIAGSSCGYSFNDNLPSTVGALFNETIYGVYQDLDPRGVSNPTESWVEGTPGCRRFITVSRNIPLFSDATVSREYTGMIVLHETTNIIEVFIENKRIENGNVSPWNGGNAIVGIQGNASAGEATVAPCRNGLDANWEATNEAWRFVPNGTVIAPTSVEWFSASTGTTVIGTGSTLDVSSLGPDTYTSEVTYNSCGATVTLSDDVVVNQSSKTWMGYVDTNWYRHANWEPNGVPTPSDCVLIPDVAISNNRSPIADETNIPGGAPVPPNLASALNLTVDPTGYLEINSGTNLQVVNWIHLDGNIDIRDTGSLIQVTEFGPNVNNNSGNGNINMQRTVTIASTYDYIYWSSPVEGFGVSNVSPGSSYIYEWIPTIAGNGSGNFGNWQATTESMINGKGYIIRNVTGTPTPSTPEFVGRPNNGVITKAITRGTYNGADYTGGGNILATNLDDNWNLVGNPYPSAISANSFIAANAAVITDDINPAISGTVYLWRHLATPSNAVNDPFYDDFVYNYNPNDYIAYNSTGSNPAGFGGDIAAGQAFFVLMEHTAPVNSIVVFNNSMRNETLNNSQFYRTNETSNQPSEIEKHRIWLDLISPESSANSILVGYIEGATNDKDRLFDGNELSETSTRFYSIINEEAYSIQGKALPFDDTDTVPLGVEISQDGNYSIALNAIDGLFENTNQAIFIEDTYLNIIHDLRVNPYSFNIDAGIYDDRFILRYTNQSLSIDELNLTSGLEITAPNNDYIKVKSGKSPINSVIVYDLLGRVLVEQKDINASEFKMNNFNYSEGTYIVKATLVDGKQKIQKVILKH